MTPSDLDPGIREVVALLRAAGFTTTDSGDGVSKAELIAEGEALDVPHVVIVVGPQDLVGEADRLCGSLRSRGVNVGPIGRGGPEITASYDPATGSAVIVLVGVLDSDLDGTP